MLLVAMRFRVHILGPHRIARDISASSEKNRLIMKNDVTATKWAQQMGAKNRGKRRKQKVFVPTHQQVTIDEGLHCIFIENWPQQCQEVKPRLQEATAAAGQILLSQHNSQYTAPWQRIFEPYFSTFALAVLTVQKNFFKKGHQTVQMHSWIR